MIFGVSSPMDKLSFGIAQIGRAIKIIQKKKIIIWIDSFGIWTRKFILSFRVDVSVGGQDAINFPHIICDIYNSTSSDTGFVL